MSDHHRLKTGERATLDPFDAPASDIPPRDPQDLMERTFFSLAKTKCVQPILYKSGTSEVQVHALPEHGMATIWDADVLIWAANTALDRGIPTSRFFRLSPYRLLTAIGRATRKREYLLLKGALSRRQSTVIRTTIRHGEHSRVARKHAGRQPHGWHFELRHLYAKSAGLARYFDFAVDLRRVVRRQPLLGYALAIEHASDGQEVVAMRAASTAAVDNLRMINPSIGILRANHIGISRAPVSGLRVHKLRPGHWNTAKTAERNEPKSASKLSVADAAHRYTNNRKYLAGAGDASWS